MSLILALAGGLVLFAAVMARVLGRRAGWPIAAGMGALAAAVAARAPGSGAVTETVSWIPTIDVALRLRLDGLSFLFALLVLIIGALVMVYSSAYTSSKGAVGFYTLMTAFAASMLLLVLADDLIVLFVAWEFTTLCSYLLILRSNRKAGPPATRTLLLTAGGGLCLLGAVALVSNRTGTTELTAALNHEAWAQDPGFAAAAAILVAVAAMTKSAQFPFHSWLPDAMVAPAPVSAYLHAAAMVKAGIFLLMLFAPAASHSPVWPVMLIGFGLITAVMGALFALQRTDLKELLAYSTVSQLGLLMAVIGVGTPDAMLAASVHVVAHALFKSAGFMHVGFLEKRLGTRDIRELSGLWRSRPWDAVMIVLAAASMAGIPPALGFVSKELVFDSMLLLPAGSALGWTVALIASAGAVLTVAYSARMVVTTLPGPAMRPNEGVRTGAMSLAISLAAVTGTGIGLTVWLLDDLLAPAAAVSAGVGAGEIYGLSLWHGFNAPLALSAAAVAGGLLITVRRTAVDRLLVGRSLFPSDGTTLVQASQDGIIRGGRRVGDLTRTDSPAAHLAVPAVLIAIAGAGLPLLWPGWGTANVEAPDVPLFIMVAAGVIAVIVARARLAAIISVGVAGFAVAIWFFVLGASDVALTQLLVEILTVVIMVLVLRRLGREFTPTPRARRVGAGIAAAVAGVTAFFATLAFTGHRGLSPVGEYFLREAENDTGGTNVVNTILVDFRALDTLGELVVLAIAALAINSLLVARRPVSGPAPSLLRTPLADPASNAVFLRVLDRFLVPLMLIGSAYALLRGHNDPGGGFIAALIGASALALAYLSASSDENRRLNRPYRAIAGAGIIVAVGCGLLGLLDDSFLRPLHFDVLGVHITTALIFDLGVYLAVFGVILAALNLLGTRQGAQETAEGLPAPEETPVTVAAPVAPAAAGRGHDDGHSTEEARS
nr:DUF4040 family protein [Sediminivirga luteola]